MDNLDEEKERHREVLKETYGRIRDNGIGLYVSATPDEIANICVQETSTYMPDYIYDENGELIQIRFDRIDK